MKIINIILLIFQRSLGDFYYILQQGNFCGPQSERTEPVLGPGSGAGD